LARDGPVDDHETLLLQRLHGFSADGFLGHFTLVRARVRLSELWVWHGGWAKRAGQEKVGK